MKPAKPLPCVPLDELVRWMEADGRPFWSVWAQRIVDHHAPGTDFKDLLGQPAGYSLQKAA